MGFIDDNLKKINDRITRACSESGRRREHIRLVAITKTVEVGMIQQAWQAGLKHFGENRIQEAARKIPRFGPGPTWHMVGHLQTNKVKKAIDLFDMVESVDSLKLAEALDAEAARKNIVMDILLEVNSSGEKSKYGLPPEEVMALAEKISRLDNLKLVGLMTIGPFTDDTEKIDRAFGLTRKLFLSMKDKIGDKISVLSMGMSADFERAIRFGSTELRIGTAIFGARGSSPSVDERNKKEAL